MTFSSRATSATFGINNYKFQTSLYYIKRKMKKLTVSFNDNNAIWLNAIVFGERKRSTTRTFSIMAERFTKKKMHKPSLTGDCARQGSFPAEEQLAASLIYFQHSRRYVFSRLSIHLYLFLSGCCRTVVTEPTTPATILLCIRPASCFVLVSWGI